jgi:beta-lactam-binding protein with PASTA domain
MIAVYVVIGAVFVVLLIQQARAFYRRSVLPSVDRYQRAMDTLGEMSGSVRILESPALDDSETSQAANERPSLATPSPLATPVVRGLPIPRQNLVIPRQSLTPGRPSTNFGQPEDNVTPEPRDTSLALAPDEPEPRAVSSNRLRLYGIVIAAAVVVGGTLLGVLLTSSSPQHLAAGSTKQSHHTSRASSPPPTVAATSPNLVGLSESKAEALLSSAGLRWRLTKVTSPVPAAVGTVVTQTPASSSPVQRGAMVTLSIGEPYPSAAVPNVASPPESIHLAEATLKKAGFTTKTKLVKVMTLRELGLQGEVLSESPAAGSMKPKHSTVVIDVVDGAATIKVPLDIVGETPAQAGATLAGSQLAVGTTRNASSPSVPAGKVAGTYPSTPGETVAVGETVNLVISTGTVEGVPDLEGDTIAQARKALRAAGLRLGQVRSGAGSDGVIVAQAAKSGRKLPEGTPIAVVVGVGTPATNTTASDGSGT